MKEVHYGSWEIGGPRHYYRERLIMKSLQKWLPSGRVLDVGCGTGSLIVKLALQGYEVYGIDTSEECLRITSQRLKGVSLNGDRNVKKGSALQIDYPDNFFNAVIAGEMLEHLENDKSAVSEFRRILKLGGICIVTVPENPMLWDMWDEKAGHKRRYSKEDILALFGEDAFLAERFFSWGFPLMRLYHRLVFLRWARRIDKKKSGRISSEDALTRIGLNRWSTVILGNLFRIDNLFSRLPWGIGILLVARKER